MPQDQEWRIRDAAALRNVIGEPMEFVRAKVLDELNPAMREFIACSPLLFLSTIDEDGGVDVSPKGDPKGFCQVTGSRELLVPERPGNRLTFGFHNILKGGDTGGEVGLIFVVPNQLETLRVKGRATLHRDPQILDTMAVGGKPALLFMRVTVTQCFFHCGKALVRSHVWQPDRWQTDRRPIAARGFASRETLDDAAIARTEVALDQSYTNDLY